MALVDKGSLKQYNPFVPYSKYRSRIIIPHNNSEFVSYVNALCQYLNPKPFHSDAIYFTVSVEIHVHYPIHCLTAYHSTFVYGSICQFVTKAVKINKIYFTSPLMDRFLNDKLIFQEQHFSESTLPDGANHYGNLTIVNVTRRYIYEVGPVRSQ